MHLNASVGLHFDGDCAAAFKFYERLLGLEPEIVLPWGASPLASQAPAGWGDKILFARLRGRDMTLLGGDLLPGTYRPPVGFSLTLSTTDESEAQRLFTELATDGSVSVPLQETFWAHRYAFVVDRFGIPWEITCAKPHGAGD
jgi:PhnB protein